MKILKTLIIFLLFSASNVEAQDFYSKVFDLYGHSSDIIWRLHNSTDGIFTTFGNRCDNFTVDCASFAKLNPSGDTLWTKRIPWLDPGGQSMAKRYNYYEISGHDYLERSKFYLHRRSFEGDSIATFELIPDEEFVELSIAGNVVFDKYSIVFGNGRRADESIPGLIYWVTESGVVDSLMYIDSGTEWNKIRDVDVDSEGNLMVLVDFQEWTTGANPNYPYRIERKQLLKYNSKMELIWEWQTDDEFPFLNSTPSRLEVLDDGTIAVFAEDTPGSHDEIWGIKEQGISWKYRFKTGSNIHKIYGITEAQNGDIIGCGHLVDNVDQIPGQNGYIFRMTDEGEMLWERAIVDYPNPDSDDDPNGILWDIIELEDGTLMAGGLHSYWYEDSNGQDIPEWDAWLVRTAADGCIIEDCDYVQDFTTSIPIFSDPIHIELYPNPASEFINISWPEEFPIREIQVYDPLGKLMLRRLYPVENERLDISGLSTGLYAVVLLDEGGRMYSEKILVQ